MGAGDEPAPFLKRGSMDKTTPEIKINLDKERALLLDLNAMRAYQQKTGKNLLKADSFETDNPDHIQAALWACLLHEDKTLTYEYAGSLVNPNNLVEVVKTILQAFTVALPEAKKDTSEPPLAPNPPHG